MALKIGIQTLIRYSTISVSSFLTLNFEKLDHITRHGIYKRLLLVNKNYVSITLNVNIKSTF